MRSFYSVMAAVLLVTSHCFAGSSNTQPPSQDTTQAVASAAPASSLEVRMQALEQKIEQLENRLNAVLPATPTEGPAPIPPADLVERLDSLDEKLQLLEHNAKVQEGPTVTAGRDTFSISSPEKTYRLRIGGHLQTDAKFFADNTGDLLTNSFNLRRARPILKVLWDNTWIFGSCRTSGMVRQQSTMLTPTSRSLLT